MDDVAALAKLAAASLDDVAGAAAKAGSKAAGVVIDDAAVTPRYVAGLHPARELPMIARIAAGSLANKLLILLPLTLLLSAYAPWLLTPLLALGGLYLCFEGAEKIAHAGQGAAAPTPALTEAAHLEKEKVRGAIKTDFILSAEIMVIALAALPPGSLWNQALALALVGLLITLAVYGSVALIVKMDDLGLALAARAPGRLLRALGRGLVAAMVPFLQLLSLVGMVAMLWVGGAILRHAMAELGAPFWEDAHHSVLHGLSPFWAWAAGAGLDAAFGLVLGHALWRALDSLAPLWAGRRPPKAH